MANNERATVEEFRANQRSGVHDAIGSGIPKRCIRRELRGHLAALAEGADDEGKLWCVAVHGPGTVIPQPSRAVAEARAALWNEDIEDTRRRAREHRREHFEKTGVDIGEVLLECHVEPYPYSAESHAEELSKHGGEPEDLC